MSVIFEAHERVCHRQGEFAALYPLSVLGGGVFCISSEKWANLEREQQLCEEGNEKRSFVHVLIFPSPQSERILDCFDMMTPYRLLPTSFLVSSKKRKYQDALILILAPTLQTFVYRCDILTRDELNYTKLPQFDPVALVHKKWHSQPMSQLEQKLAFFVILVWASAQSTEIQQEVLSRERAFISSQIDNRRLIELHLFNLQQEIRNTDQELRKGWKKITL